MPLKTNATLTFTAYEVIDEPVSGIRLHFVAPDPGPGEPSDWYVIVTDTELATITTAAQFRTLVLGKLQRKFRATGLASRLDPYIGQQVTI